MDDDVPLSAASREYGLRDDPVHVVESLNIPVARYCEVQVSVKQQARSKGSQTMRLDPAGFARRLERSRDFAQQRLVGLVHQPAHRLANQPPSCVQDMQANGDGDERVEDRPTRQSNRNVFNDFLDNILIIVHWDHSYNLHFLQVLKQPVIKL